VDISIKPGEFFTLLGPSGCGKTTLLRMIAGFNSIDGGEICFDDKVINHVEAHKRDIGMVFQNYAIFPHMNVSVNVAYGLKARKVESSSILKRVENALEQVQIQALASRKPSELSGGQQQRVALARAIVLEPGVLLMDEPLSNLDAKLRVQMRTVIKKLQRKLGITTIYVTHDQEEALAISDRIAVMKDGSIIQVGSPLEIYKKPSDPFVAGFIGTSNFLDATVDTSSSENTLVGKTYGCNLPIVKDFTGDVVVSIRPEHFFFSEAGLRGTIVLSTFLGDFINYEVQLENGQTVELNEYTKDMDDLRDNDSEVYLSFLCNKVSVFDAHTKEVLT
jgi:iron(III) transport system ATP-binding protein